MVDGETIAEYLHSSGFTLVDTFDTANIIIVNTCTFIQEATEETINTIFEMARYKTVGVCTTLVVSGCFSERYRNSIKKDFPEVDLWVGINTWQEELSCYLKKEGTLSYKRQLTGPFATQYLKISDGCSHRCTYCIIPAIRGTFRSRTINAILEEAQWLSEQGVRECIIVSQDTSYYGRDIGTSLTLLLETLLNKTDFHWIRMMYLHPRYINDTLLKLIASEKRLCSYFDIPLQHIADPLLKAMNRTQPSSKNLYSLIEHIRAFVPDVTIRTTFILGFPGETLSQFNQLLKFTEWARFEKLGVFPFSPEEGTKAFNMKPRPRTKTALERCEILMDMQKEISREIYESRIGFKSEIILDRVSEDLDYNFIGRTQGDAPEIDGQVFILNGNMSVGSFTDVQIVGASDFDMYAKISAEY